MTVVTPESTLSERIKHFREKISLTIEALRGFSGVAFSDMDGTLIKGYSMTHFGEFIQQVREGKGDFPQALGEICGRISGRAIEDFVVAEVQIAAGRLGASLEVANAGESDVEYRLAGRVKAELVAMLFKGFSREDVEVVQKEFWNYIKERRQVHTWIKRIFPFLLDQKIPVVVVSGACDIVVGAVANGLREDGYQIESFLGQFVKLTRWGILIPEKFWLCLILK